MPAFIQRLVNEVVKYEENPELVKENFEQLREWLSTQTKFPDISDEMLEQFHHSCFYNMEQTKSCIKTYYSTRRNIPEVFSNRDFQTQEMIRAAQTMHLAVLPIPDSRGCYLVHMRLNDTDPANFDYLYLNRLLFMVIDSAIQQYGKMSGIIFVYDMKGGKLSHLLRVNISLALKFAVYLQDGIPVRLREIHGVNVLPWVDKVIAIFKPILKKELFENLHLHRSDSETLFDHFESKMLPEELGGTLPSISVLHAETIERLKKMQSFFEEEEKSRQLVIRGTEPENKMETIVPSFKTLEID